MTKIWSTLSCWVGGATWAWSSCGQLSKTMFWCHWQVRFWTVPSGWVMVKPRLEEELMTVGTGSG